jgi:Arc-like DNA binding domain.
MTPKGENIMSKKDAYTRDEDSRFTLRINTEILEAIKEEAQKNKRSTGKQIEFILENWLSQDTHSK